MPSVEKVAGYKVKTSVHHIQFIVSKTNERDTRDQ
ncbi:hypothetical protein AWRI1631_132340 [Saccharomyces cerevisiae AWRI1631]|uniref:Uncharacterized protein n=1 Tax=Saccharomyces cerevisiae (strain AWRI1631) TaxID=545124 RepID=B5VPL9_YEAS6|nr:hypothetical protein AWRI1631_132340 [Saccharomyces cerevisiae AWRI1631]